MVDIQPSCWWSAALGGLQRRFLVRDGGDRVLLREKGEIEKKKINEPAKGGRLRSVVHEAWSSPEAEGGRGERAVLMDGFWENFWEREAC
jgi:hypothetical protein